MKKIIAKHSESGIPVLSARQCRAGRAWLDWTQEQLAEKAGIGVATVRAFERDARAPRPPILIAMRYAMEKAGIRFEPAGGMTVAP